MTISITKGLTAHSEALMLSPGAHATREDGLCAMEAAAWLAGLEHSDRPRCTTEVIAAYVRHLNDNMPDDARGRLIPYIPRIIGIPDDGRDYLRNEVFAWHAVRRIAPAALRYQGHKRHALKLQRQTCLRSAKETSTEVVRLLGDKYQDLTPIQLLVYRAGEAASAAAWFSDKRDWPLGGATPMTPHGACAKAAAGCAFQAWRAGLEEAWDLALDSLDEVLTIKA